MKQILTSIADALDCEKSCDIPQKGKNMEVQPGELFDRLSITELKSERIDSKLTAAELNELQNAFNCTRENHPSLNIECEDMVELLKKINGFIWDLESDIRQGKEGELGLEEVGRRALLIRDLNSIRVWTKNLITKATGQGAIEHKKDHASSEDNASSSKLLKKIKFSC